VDGSDATGGGAVAACRGGGSAEGEASSKEGIHQGNWRNDLADATAEEHHEDPRTAGDDAARQECDDATPFTQGTLTATVSVVFRRRTPMSC
jgi:hypothetical protein